MAFTNKSLHSARNGMSIIKWATLFFLGMTCVMFATQALQVKTIATSAIQYISKIVLTTGGTSSTATGIYLNGVDGSAYFSGDVGIGTATPTEKLQVSGTGKFTNSDITSKLYVGSTAYLNGGLEVKGNVKNLRSINANSWWHSGNIYIPSLVDSGVLNTWWDNDSIWYINCNEGTGIFLFGFTGQNISFWINFYIYLTSMWGSTLTYHLKAWETAYIYGSGICNEYVAYSQLYGSDTADWIFSSPDEFNLGAALTGMEAHK